MSLSDRDVKVVADTSPADPHLVKLPLCVDLDGTLIKTDVLVESLIALVKQNLWTALLIPCWLFRGRAFLKRELAARSPLATEQLPYRADVLEFLTNERKCGRQILLVTASDQATADKIAADLNQFDGVYGSDGTVNLKGAAKAGFLVGLLGKGNFDYIGNSTSDLPVWKAARAAYVVGSQRVAKKAARVAPREFVSMIPK